MKRRVVEAPPGSPPAKLCRFQLEGWVDPWEPLPDWWDLSKDGSLAWFRYFQARLRYGRAVRAWCESNSVGFWEWDVARGACDAACRRDHPYQHAHG